MSEKRDRDPFNDRYSSSESEETLESEETSESSVTSESSKTSKSAETEETEETAKSEETGETVRDRTNVNMYLPDGLVDDLQLRYSELNVEWRRQHGDDLPKNAEYYPAVIRAGLEGTTVEDQLPLDADEQPGGP